MGNIAEAGKFGNLTAARLDRLDDAERFDLLRKEKAAKKEQHG